MHSWTDKDNRLTISSPRYYSTEQWDITDSGLIGLFVSKSELQISFTFVAFLADIYRCSGRPSIPASHSGLDDFSALVSTLLAPRFHWKNAARDFPGPGGIGLFTAHAVYSSEGGATGEHVESICSAASMRPIATIIVTPC